MIGEQGKFDSGVSPVVSVILLVAISVVLAAAVMVLVVDVDNTLSDSPSNTAGVELYQSGEGDYIIEVTDMGGNDELVARCDGKSLGSIEELGKKVLPDADCDSISVHAEDSERAISVSQSDELPKTTDSPSKDTDYYQTAADIIVDPSNANHPDTIPEGVEAASEGDTVYVTENEHTDSVSTDKSITIAAESGAVLRGDGSGTGVVLGNSDLSNGVSDATLQGLEVTNFSTGVVVRGQSNNVSIQNVRSAENAEYGFELDYKFTAPTGVTIEDSELVDNGQDGIYVPSTGAELTANNLTVAGNEQHGVNTGSATVTITESELAGNSGYGVNAERANGGSVSASENYWGGTPEYGNDYFATSVHSYCTSSDCTSIKQFDTVAAKVPELDQEHHHIQQAADIATEGDTINVEPGTYEYGVGLHTDGLTLNGSGATFVGDGSGRGVHIEYNGLSAISDVSVQNISATGFESGVFVSGGDEQHIPR